MGETQKILKEIFFTNFNNWSSAIVLPGTNATHFDLKSHVINLLPNFHGMERGDPNLHVKEFWTFFLLSNFKTS